jgi:hypothetical protein
MKPTPPSTAREQRFPLTDYCFHSGMGDWRGGSWHNDDHRSEFRDFYRLSHESLAVCARERAKEMWVFSLVVLTAAWPVIYMLVVVIKLLQGRPLG